MQDTEGKKGRHLLEAILMETDGGKGESKERIVMPLAGIEERYLNTKELGMRAFHRGLFWMIADRKLDDLNLEKDLRKRIEAALAVTVPRPADDWGLWAVTCIPKYEK